MHGHHLDARQYFVTEQRHGGAQTLFEETREKLRPAVTASCSRGKVPVLGGFIASSRNGFPTTLGRGGSDLTATIAGAALEAEEVQIWTDVDGVMTADPSLIKSARSLPVLSLSRSVGTRVLRGSRPASLDDAPGDRARRAGARDQFAQARFHRNADRCRAAPNRAGCQVHRLQGRHHAGRYPFDSHAHGARIPRLDIRDLRPLRNRCRHWCPPRKSASP